jgi:hypothetical protein
MQRLICEALGLLFRDLLIVQTLLFGGYWCLGPILIMRALLIGQTLLHWLLVCRASQNHAGFEMQSRWRWRPSRTETRVSSRPGRLAGQVQSVGTTAGAGTARALASHETILRVGDAQACALPTCDKVSWLVECPSVRMLRWKASF